LSAKKLPRKEMENAGKRKHKNVENMLLKRLDH